MQVNKEQISKNAVTSVLQALVSGVLLFFLYKYLMSKVGTEGFGIWSLVMALTSFAQITNLGLSGSVVKFVAKELANDEVGKAALVIQTSIVSISVISGIFILVLFPLLSWLLSNIADGLVLTGALSLLPYALFSFWIRSLAAVFISSLDGYMRTDLKNLILVSVNALNFFFCLIFVPRYGVIGIIYSTILSNVLALMSSWFLLRKHNPFLPMLPRGGDLSILKEIIGYAGNFQLISLAGMLGDSVTKALLSKFGEISAVAFYEMANRLVLQIRALLISAYQAIIPVVANLKERNPESIRAVYLKAYSILYYLAILVYTVLLVAFPGISMVWIGYKEPLFIFLGQILAVAWFLNTLSVPAYVFSLGLGVLKWNVIGHMVIGMLNLLAGYLCGLLWGITGVVSASFLALVVGSLVISYPILVANNLRASSYLPKESRMMTVSILLFFSVISFARILWGRPTSLLLEAGVISATVLFLALVGVKNPMRKSVLSWVCRAAG